MEFDAISNESSVSQCQYMLGDLNSVIYVLFNT